MNELELRRSLRQLAAGRSPQRDLWPEIAASISERPATSLPAAGTTRRRQRWAGWALAASVLGAAILLWPLQADRTGLDPPALAASAPSPEPAQWQASMMHFEYQLALAQAAGAPLPRELQPVAQELKDSEQALRDALRQQPGSTYLLAQLRRTYQQQLRLSQLARLG
jgi:hypothetical protein